MLKRIGASVGVAVGKGNVDHKTGYHIHQSKNDEWYWNYYKNGREISRASETYSSRADCRRSIAIMKASADAVVYGEDGSPENVLRRP